MEYYAAELELNAKFHMFAQNCSQVHVGHNTVQQQLKFKSKRGKIISHTPFANQAVFCY